MKRYRKLKEEDLYVGQVVYFYNKRQLESIGIVVKLKGEKINVKWHDYGYDFCYFPMKCDKNAIRVLK